MECPFNTTPYTGSTLQSDGTKSSRNVQKETIHLSKGKSIYVFSKGCEEEKDDTLRYNATGKNREKGFLTAQAQSTQGRMTFADTVRTEKPPEMTCACMNVTSDFGQSVNVILKELLVDAFINKREATDLSNTS